jgi:hypothetical protein
LADLEIDYGRLDALIANLSTVRSEFESAERFAEQTAELTGHDGLASVVRDFAAKWNVRREELLGELLTISDASEAIRDTMRELDLELADAAAQTLPDHVAGGGGGGGGGGGR